MPAKKLASRAGKGYIARDSGNGKDNKMPFQYNPTEFSDSMGYEMVEIISPGAPRPNVQYVSVKARTVTLTVFLDALEASRHNVTLDDWKNFLDSFIPSEKTLKPSKIILSYGTYYKSGFLVGLERKFTMFDEELNPVRMEATLTIKVIDE
jgi:hypothetical protein